MAISTLTQLLEKMSAGNEVALARLMTLVERDGDEVGPILEAIAPRLGTAFTIGITGPPGAGKSSLVDGLATLMRAAGKTVGVVAGAPPRPVSGGGVGGGRRPPTPA